MNLSSALPKRFLILITVIFFTSNFLMAETDLTQNYRPVEVMSAPPDAFLETIVEKLERAREISREAEEEFDEDLYLATYIGRESLFLNGHILYEDEFTRYVNDVAAVLLKDQPELLNELNIYVSRLPISNASAWVDGVIVIYMDLLTRYDNEAQLAGLLSHEIAHYTERHQIRKREFEERIEEFSDQSGDLTRLIAQMEHSRDHEFEADRLGYQKLDRSVYSAREMISGLEVLEKTIFPANYSHIDLAGLFTNDNYEADSAKIAEANEIMQISESPSEYYSGDEADNLRERLSTHPNINRRISSLKEREAEYPERDALFSVSEERFMQIREKARFEAIDGIFNKGNYGRTFFEVVNLMEAYPENRFLAKKAAQSLYNLVYYQYIEDWDHILPATDEVAGNFYKGFIHFLRAHNSSQLQEMAYYYIRELSETFQNEPGVWVARGMITELYLESSMAREVYESYLNKFPEGPHVNFVQFKLENL